MINHALIEVSKLDVNGSSQKLSTIDVTIASGAASLFGTGALLITTSSIRKTILHIILIYSASCFLCVCKRENKGPCTRIRISLNAQLFLSGLKKFPRPHVSEFKSNLLVHTFPADLYAWFIVLEDGSSIRKEKVADSKIAGYAWTGPECLFWLGRRLKFRKPAWFFYFTWVFRAASCPGLFLYSAPSMGTRLFFEVNEQ